MADIITQGYNTARDTARNLFAEAAIVMFPSKSIEKYTQDEIAAVVGTTIGKLYDRIEDSALAVVELVLFVWQSCEHSRFEELLAEHLPECPAREALFSNDGQPRASLNIIKTFFAATDLIDLSDDRVQDFMLRELGFDKAKLSFHGLTATHAVRKIATALEGGKLTGEEAKKAAEEVIDIAISAENISRPAFMEKINDAIPPEAAQDRKPLLPGDVIEIERTTTKVSIEKVTDTQGYTFPVNKFELITFRVPLAAADGMPVRVAGIGILEETIRVIEDMRARREQ